MERRSRHVRSARPSPARPTFFTTISAKGRFEDVSKSSGFEHTNGHYCFSVTTLDYNDDGWPDIYVACDSTPSILYRNNHNGTFTDVAADAGVAFNEDGREQAGMGSTSADYDGDGQLDLFKTNFSDDTSTLYHNNGDGTFTDVTFAAGLGINTDALGWGAMFADVDNDGWPDLLVVNGHVYPEVDSAKLGSFYREPRFLYYNLGNGKFRDISKTSGPGLHRTPLRPRPRHRRSLQRWPHRSRHQQPQRLPHAPRQSRQKPEPLARSAPHRHISNRDAIGARVTLHGTTRVWVDEVRSGSSYNSSSDLRLHFGLGTETQLKDIQVRWPNGNVELFNPPSKLDHFLDIVEGNGLPPIP